MTVIDPRTAKHAEPSAPVYEMLKEHIRVGTFEPGAPLRAAQLADLIGVSRTPIREALSRLAAEGVVDMRHGRGARLSTILPHEVDEIFDLRALLEPFAAGRAAVRATEADIEELAEILERMDKIGDHYENRDLARLNDSFHRRIVEIGGPNSLAGVLVAVTREPLLHQIVLKTTDGTRRQADQHHAIIDALRSGNATWAEAAMLAHIESTRLLYR